MIPLKRHYRRNKPFPRQRPNLQHPHCNKLLAWWIFNDVGAGAANARSCVPPFIKPTSVVGTPSFAHQFGEVGLLFDKTNPDKLHLGSATRLSEIADVITVFVRCKGSLPEGNGSRIITLGNGSQGDDWGIQYDDGNNGRIRWRINDDSHAFQTNIDDETEIWTVAANYDGALREGFFNGVFVNNNSGVSGAIDTAGLVAIGGHPDTGSRDFNGMIYDVRVWNRVLREAEIRDIHNNPYAAFERRIWVPVSAPAAETTALAPAKVSYRTKPPPDATPNRSHPHLQGIVGWWLFNRHGDTKLHSVINPDIAGTITSAPWSNKGSETGLDFDGSNDEVTFGSGTALSQITSEITLVARFRADTFNMGSGGRLISHDNGGTGDHYSIGWSSGSLDFRINNSYVTRGTLSTSTDHFVAGVYDGTNRYYYIDGDKVGTVATTGSISTGQDVSIGRNPGSSSRYFYGLIYDVRVYDKALSAALIRDIYQNPFAPFDRRIWVPVSVAGAGATEVGLTGVGGSSALGSVAVAGNSAATLSGVSGTPTIGALAISGNAVVVADGVSGTGAIGTLSPTGGAGVGVAGVLADGSVGEISIAGNSAAVLTGTAATGGVGTITVQVGGSVEVTLVGVQPAGSVGTLALSAGASIPLTGVTGTSDIGTLTIGGATAITLTGVGATGAIGTLTIDVGGTEVTLSGVTSTGEIGTLTLAGGVQVDLSGVQGAGQVGTVLTVIGETGQVTAVITLGGALEGSSPLEPAVSGSVTIN